MAFDGITIAALAKELKEKLIGGRIYKIAQPEKDELMLTIKTPQVQHRLFMSADPSLPLLYLTEVNKPAPLTAPNFCMLLRKHLQNARIVSIHQPGLERTLSFELEHLDELGDLCHHFLIIELMGKHSNIILVDEKNKIVDSIKRISGLVSSVREVLPGRDYFLPDTKHKKDPLYLEKEEFLACITEPTENMPVTKALYTKFTGISPLLAAQVAARALMNDNADLASLSLAEREALWREFANTLLLVKKEEFSPAIYYENNEPKEFSALTLTGFSQSEAYESMSMLLVEYYARRNQIVRIRQKSSDLRRVVQTAIERTSKKYDLQLLQLEDTKKRDKYRLYGELLTTYGYGIAEGSKKAEVLNYYTNEMITIPLEPEETPLENAKRFFEKYNKLKRTYEALIIYAQESKAQLTHLESVAMALELASKEEDLVPIKEELVESGFIKRRAGDKRPKITSKPLQYRSSDGYLILVGKNNYQNEELTFKVAGNKDWWFHAKNIPGSHVIVRCDGEELPDRTFEEAAGLAAFYSKAKSQEKVEVDYTQRKNVKKPAGGAPGYVIYHTNYSMMAKPQELPLEH